MNLKQLTNIIIISLLCIRCTGQTPNLTEQKEVKVAFTEPTKPLPIIVGAERTTAYLKELQGKKVGVVANHTSMIKTTHLIDSLVSPYFLPCLLLRPGVMCSKLTDPTS